MKKLNITLFTVLGFGLLGVACTGGDGTGNTTTDTDTGAGNSTSTGGSGTGSGPGTGGGGGVASGGGGGVASGGGGGVASGGGAGAGDSGGGGGLGSGGGDIGSGGGVAVPELELVVSGPAASDKVDCDCWKEAPLTAGGTTATVTVSDTALRDWIGWGGTFNEAGWSALMTLSQADRDKVMQLLFNVNDGIGFTWGRIPIGSSDYAMAPYSLNETSGDTAMANFSIEHDKDANRGLIPYIKAALAVKGDIKFWGSAWSPPTWMKTNGAFNKGAMKSDKANLDAYALYLAKWVQAYEAEGIDINFVVPQNEPGWAQNYPSAAWGPSTDDGVVTTIDEFMGDFVVDNLQPIFEDNSVEADIWYGTLSNNDHLPTYWTNNATKLKPIVKGIGLQWATIDSLSTIKDSGLLVLQSEHECGNNPWEGGAKDANGQYTSSAASIGDAKKGNFWAPQAPNNYNYALDSWTLMKKWIDGGVNGYSAWNMVLNTGGFNLDQVRKWPQNALIAIDEAAKSYRLTPTYYLFRHMAQYVDPGAKVLTVTGDALAFKNPDGAIVAIVHSTAGGATTVSIAGQMYQVTIPANGWATINKKP